MPVNMDPKNRRRRVQPIPEEPKAAAPAPRAAKTDKNAFGEETEEDREKALADAEWKNLWDATEVIDMDKW